MKLETAIEILDYHQEWRLGKREDMIHEPKKLTEALDIVLCEVKKLLIHGAVSTFKCDCGCTNHYKNEIHDSIMCADCGTIYANI